MTHTTNSETKTTGLIIVLAALILLFGGIFLFVPQNAQAPTVTTQTTGDITYQGVEGKTALELLKSSHLVETQSFSAGEFVKSIDGIKPDANHFWAFYLNGAQASVGAGSYITKSGDSIRWHLEAITN